MSRHSVWVLVVALVAVGVAVALGVLRWSTSGDGTVAAARPATSPASAAGRAMVPTASTGPQVTLRPSRTPAPTVPPSPIPSPSPSSVGVRYAFPVAGCETDYAAAHHDYPATDIFTGPDCTFVAPVDGRVDEIGWTDHWDPAISLGATRGGLFVSVVGDDGVRYYGSHLAAIAAGLEVGQSVHTGQPLGRIGDTGSARGTGIHLHFGISWPTEHGYWWIRRGVLAPSTYLDSWRSGGNLSPVDAVRSLRAGYGDDSTCRTYC